MKTSFSTDIEKNIENLKNELNNDGTIIYRSLKKNRAHLIFVNGMVNNDIINLSIIAPLTNNFKKMISSDKPEDFLYCSETKRFTDTEEALSALLSGDTLLLIEDCDYVIGCSTRGGEFRSIGEPDSEKNLKGPREGFCEILMINTSLIRRRLNTNALKFEMSTLGERTNTKICICYLDNLVNKKALTELKKRIAKVEIDGIFDANYIEEYIKDHKFSPFKTIGSTEKPDIVAANLIEGRIAILVDGTPIVLTVPYLFIENFQSNDDYYLNFYFASMGRMLRIIGFIISITLPGFYIALICYHHEMIPAGLLLNIVKASKSVPFPLILECLIMLVAFEMLRETGVRIPGKLGQALSIVGALVLGQAAVESGIISNAVVIVVATTGITGLLVPKLKGASIIMRLICMFLAGYYGMYGLFLSITFLIVYLASLSSFSVDYLQGFGSTSDKQHKDILIRAPISTLKRRPSFAADIIREGKSVDINQDSDDTEEDSENET